MAESRVHTLRMMAPPDDVNTVHSLLETVWADAPGISMIDRFSFETALIELASNVIRHAQSRGGVSCTVSVETTDDRIKATLNDSSEPGDFQMLDREMPDEFAESGRGLALINKLVDELTYSRENNLNYWHIMRKRES